MTAIQSGRVTREYTQRIDAPPQTVFPLLCPVRESEWLDGWREGLEMIHSESGLAEEGCVFVTRSADRPETTWTITRHDPALKVVEFYRVTSGLVATHLSIRVEATVNGASSVHIRYTFTPMNDAGRAFVKEHYSEILFREDMAWWEQSMNHWLRTGALLPQAHR